MTRGVSGNPLVVLRDQVEYGAERRRAAPLPRIGADARLTWVVGAEPRPDGPDPSDAPGEDASAADDTQARLLGEWAERAAVVLVVEDDLAHPDDWDMSAGRPDRRVMDRDDAAAVGRFVLHWMLVEPGSADSVPELLRTSASGYPTVAYAVPARLAERMRAKTWDLELAEEAASSATALVVSAFDDEGWLVCELSPGSGGSAPRPAR
jgi:hypothetical protein